MKNLAAKLFLVVMAVSALSAAIMASTAGYDNLANNVTVAQNGGNMISIIEPAGDAVIHSLAAGDGQAKCYIEWEDKRRGKIRLQIKCPVRQK
jgi:hypothetical protein